MVSRGLVVSILLAAVPVGVTGWVLAPIFLDPLRDHPPATAGAVRAPGPQQTAAATTARDAAHFDVARIDRGGWSVFAGTAPPHSFVTVTANGLAVGTVKSDAAGEWTLVSDYKFADRNPPLALTVGRDNGPALAGEPRRPQETREAGNRAASSQATAPAASKRMMQNLEDLVATARRPETAAGTAATVRASPAVVPVPVQFVFRQAAFTEEGRKAAALLLEYLKLRKPDTITLTGHADERGSEAFNMELSRQRLDTVAAYLRENGIDTHLQLIPKGSSEPYQGVERGRLDREALYQIDRRVELLVNANGRPDRSVENTLTRPAPRGR